MGILNLKHFTQVLRIGTQYGYSHPELLSVWVQQLELSSSGIFATKRSTFKVTPTAANDIGSLKDAIKVELPSLKGVHATDIAIYTKARAGKWTAVMDQKQSLTSGTDYGYSLRTAM